MFSLETGRSFHNMAGTIRYAREIKNTRCCNRAAWHGGSRRATVPLEATGLGDEHGRHERKSPWRTRLRRAIRCRSPFIIAGDGNVDARDRRGAPRHVVVRSGICVAMVMTQGGSGSAGSTGSTTVACSSPSATFHPQRRKGDITPCSPNSVWRPHLTLGASGKLGGLQSLI